MFSMKKEVRICIIGKVYNPNFRKLLKLNKCLEQYFKLVRFYIKEIEKQKTTSKVKLHNSTYEQVKQKYHLPSALTQSARDKAVEIYRSFRKNSKKNSKLKLKRISIRFDKRITHFQK